jgi:hypothetical protein
MLTAGSRTVVKIETVSSVSAAMRQTMTSMTPTMTNPPDVVLQLEAVMQEGSSRSPVIWGGCASRITSSHQGFTSMMGPTTRLSGSRYINLPLKPSERTRTSWQIICWSAYHHQPGRGSWGSTHDLVSVVQKKGESFQKFIQRFCNKRNIITEVDDKSIIMFFKKGLRDSSLICMRHPTLNKGG